MRYSLSLAVLAALLLPFSARAQKVVPFLVMAPDRATCDRAMAALQSGKRASSLPVQISDCGDAGVSQITAALMRQASSVDTIYWRDLSNALWRIRDERLLATATIVATSTTASAPARLVALSALWSSLGHALRIDAWRDAPVVPAGQFDIACLELNAAPQSIVQWRAPAGDVPRRVAAVLDALLGDGATPPIVRRSASCMRRGISLIPRVLLPNSVAVSYDCDNRFDLKFDFSKHRSMVEIELDGETSPMQIPWTGASTRSVTLSSPRDLVVRAAGQVIVQARHGYQSCLAGRYRAMGQQIPLGVDTLAGWVTKKGVR